MLMSPSRQWFRHTGLAQTGACLHVQTFSLPDLQPGEATPLRRLARWDWDWQTAVLPCADRATRCAACSASGLLTVVGPCQELLRVGAAATPAAAPCGGFYDPDVAAAAYAAECQDARPRTASLQGARPSGAAAADAGVVGLLRSAIKSRFDSVSGSAAAPRAQALHMRPGTHLQPLFSALPPSPRAAASPFGWGSPRAASPPPRPPPKATAAAVAAGGTAVLTRTPSEIRRAYGKGDVQGTRAVMQDNVAQLHARGARLQALEGRMEDFSHEAESFAAMTKQLEREANRPWWKPF